MFLLVSLSCITESHSAEGSSTAAVIAQKTLDAYYYARSDGRAVVHLRLVNKDGKERIREFVMLRLDKEDGGEQFYYAFFRNPPDVRRTVFLVWKHTDRDDDRWLYLPAIDLVRRISSDDKRFSFVGSDFTYEDISGRRLEDDDHELVKQEAMDGRETFVIKSVPKDTDAVEFSYRLIWSDRQTFLPVRIEHYNKKEKLYKVMEVKKIQHIQDTPTITKAFMKNLDTGHSTELTVAEIVYDNGLGPDLFQERYLRRPPGKWIKQ